MKFDVWKDIVSQSSYFKSRPDLVTSRGGGSCREEPKILENAYSGGIEMKLGGKNNNKSYIRDWHNRNGSALFGVVVGGGGLILKN